MLDFLGSTEFLLFNLGLKSVLIFSNIEFFLSQKGENKNEGLIKKMIINVFVFSL